MRQVADLFAQLCSGAKQFLVAQQESLDAFSDLADLGGLVLVRHGNQDCRVCSILPRRIRSVGARSVVHTLQFNGKQEEVNAIATGPAWFASAAISNLRCPRNGKRTNAVP